MSNGFDLAAIRAQFPALGTKVHGGKPLLYLDSGASAQKPDCVIDCMVRQMQECYANVHRGAHSCSERTTLAYEQARERVARFLNAGSDEIVFTGSTTGSINLVAHAYGRGVLQPGDEVITSLMEHHSNFVPWQQLRDDHGIVLKFIPVKDDGTLDLEAYGSLLSPRTKLVALTHVSNVLGTCNPIAECAQMAHHVGAKLLVDGSQAVMHSPVDVKALDVDFYAFTGHKIYGPTGIGVLYGRKALLDSMPPFMGGGEMIARVHPDATVWADPPARFEAGTPPIVQAIGLGAAIDFVASVGFEAIGAHEQRLKHAAIGALRALDGVRVYGHEDHSDAAFSSGPIISFSLRGCHPHDVATLLDMEGIAVRAGHHCAEPLAQFFGLESGSLRASLALYNSEDEIHKLVSALEKAKRILT